MDLLFRIQVLQTYYSDQFSTHAKTQVIGEVGIGQTIIDVDSTLGFPSAGTLS